MPTIKPLDSSRRGSTLFQFTTERLRHLIDPNHLLIRTHEAGSLIACLRCGYDGGLSTDGFTIRGFRGRPRPPGFDTGNARKAATFYPQSAPGLTDGPQAGNRQLANCWLRGRETSHLRLMT